MKNIILPLILSVSALAGCSTDLYPASKQIENSFAPEYIESSADLTFTSPNFSAHHAPPLISGFAYVESYDAKEVCGEKSSYIGKVTITRGNKTQFSKLPSGKVVANVGYHSAGATGGGLRGNTYYLLNVEPEGKYRITLEEARPFVTSYTVSITKLTEAGNSANVTAKAYKNSKSLCEALASE